MSWSDRRLFLTSLVSFAALAGCGFTPVYGPGGSAEGLRGAITVAAPDEPNGYELVKRLEERLGRNLSAPYTLNYVIATEVEGVGITKRQEITRNQILGTIDFTVTSNATGKVVQQGSVSNFTSFSTEGSTVSTAAVERDAYRRLMVSMADMIVTRFLGTYSSWAK